MGVLYQFSFLNLKVLWCLSRRVFLFLRKYTMGYSEWGSITFADCSQMVQRKTGDNGENAIKCQELGNLREGAVYTVLATIL